MTPKALYEGASSSDESNPRCLCPLKGIDMLSNLDLGQTSITQACTGLYTGEFIFICASKACGYIGQSTFHSFLNVYLTYCWALAPLERIYNNGGYIRPFILKDRKRRLLNNGIMLLNCSGHALPGADENLGLNIKPELSTPVLSHKRPLKRSYALLRKQKDFL